MYMREKTSSSKGSLLREQSAMVDCDQRYSESISLHAEQVGPTRALSLNAILQPPTATVHTGISSSSSTQDGGKEERRDPGRKRGQKGGMKLASSIWRRGVSGSRGRGGGQVKRR